jgi:glycosyltransferase involved in cell wall biosynthesis
MMRSNWDWNREVVDFTFNILTKHNSWILGGIIEEVIPFCPGEVNLNEFLSLRREKLTKPRIRTKSPQFGQVNILIHHQIIEKFPKRILEDQSYEKRILLTHFDPPNVIPLNFIENLKNFKRILVQNSQVKSQLESSGKMDNKSKIDVWFGAVDRKVYYPTPVAKRDFVLIVGDCKPRKNPELVAKVIEMNPEIDFIIHGKGWSNNEKIKRVLAKKNIQLIPFDLKLNPVLMRNASLLLSLSALEGGPFPVLESLASGTPVVATNTGFCDEIVNQERGLCVPIESTAETISGAMHSTLERFANRERRDLLNGQFSWRDLAIKVFQSG